MYALEWFEPAMRAVVYSYSIKVIVFCANTWLKASRSLRQGIVLDVLMRICQWIHGRMFLFDIHHGIPESGPHSSEVSLGL